MSVVIIEAMCLPPVAVISQMLIYDGLSLEAQEHYQKRSFRNRVYIAGPNGRQLLTVPLSSGKNQSLPIKDVTIAYDEDWIEQWLLHIQNAYSNAPYYIYYKASLTTILRAEHMYLWDLNEALLQWSMEVIDLHFPIQETTTYHKNYSEETGTIDLRNKYLPNEKLWTSIAPSYGQVFEAHHGFIAHLSILDLIMCLGPESKIYLRSLTKS